MSEQIPPNTVVDVLLIEDNPGDIRLTREALDEGHVANTLHVVNDGTDALDFLNERGEHGSVPRPDLILLDLNLPRKNGDEFLEKLRETAPRLARIPVIALTGSQAEEDIVKSYERGANAYMTKPVDPSELVATVQSFEDFWVEGARLPLAREKHE